MSLITPEFYSDNYCSGLYSDGSDELPALIQIASDMINSVCGGKIPDTDSLNALPDNIIHNVKLAVCAQTSYLERSGGLSSIDSPDPVQMSLGKFSYMNASGTAGRKYLSVSPLALSYLELSGLLYRGLRSRD